MTISIIDDVVSKFGAVRDQGKRPTCAAFAVSDFHAAVRSGVWLPLSPEYVFYCACVRSPQFDPHSGVTLGKILEAVAEDGQPEEKEWPYLQSLPNDLNAYKPPSIVSPIYRRPCEKLRSSVDRLQKEISAGRPVMVVFQSTLNFVLAKAGVAVKRSNSDQGLGLHAAIAVAMGEQNGERCVRVRNSWGEKWAENGYAWVAEDYLRSQLIAVVRMV